MPVPTEYSPDTVVRDSPVSSMIESTNTANTNDCPGPDANSATAAAATMAHP